MAKNKIAKPEKGIKNWQLMYIIEWALLELEKRNKIKNDASKKKRKISR